MEDDTPTRKSVGTIGDAELATGPAIITLQRWRRIWGYVSQLAIILLHVGPSGARTFGGLGHGGTCVCRRVGMRSVPQTLSPPHILGEDATSEARCCDERRLIDAGQNPTRRVHAVRE